MNKIILSAVFVLFTLMSCSTSLRGTKMTIASQQVDCVGVGPQKCYLIKSGNESNWQYLYSKIEGFSYEPGYEYVLDVKIEKIENPPADHSSTRYILVKEISKTKKQSENIPGV